MKEASETKKCFHEFVTMLENQSGDIIWKFCVQCQEKWRIQYVGKGHWKFREF